MGLVGAGLLTLFGHDWLGLFLHPRFHGMIAASGTLLLIFSWRAWRDRCARSSLEGPLAWAAAMITILIVFLPHQITLMTQAPPPQIVVPTPASTPFSSFAETSSSSSMVAKISSSSMSSSSEMASSSLVSQKKVMSTPPHHKETPAPATGVQRTNLPWMVSELRNHNWGLEKEVWVRGFVHRQSALNQRNEIGLVRSLIVCCAADAIAIGFRMTAENLPRYENGQWLMVRGHLRPDPSEPKSGRAPWERNPDIFYGKGVLFVPDSLIPIPGEIPDPYVFYQANGDFSEF